MTQHAVPKRSEARSSKPTRRRPGEARRLLLQAARDLFSEWGYSATSTREIADLAGVSENLMFKYFGSKAGLFREALVVPFVEFVDDFNAKWESGYPEEFDNEEVARMFVGDLFDLFRNNRALVIALWTAGSLHSPELAEIGVFEVNKTLRKLALIGTDWTIRRRGEPVYSHDLSTRSTVAMIAGMAVFGEPFYGKRPPSRKAIVEEITQMILHGHLHRRH